MGQTVVFTYTWRGEESVRHVVPMRVWFGATDLNPQEQWMLDALDIERQAIRSFAMAAIRDWHPYSLADSEAVRAGRAK